MTPVVEDIAALSRLDPRDVRAYLEANGWTLADEDQGRVAHFRKVRDGGGEDVEVAVPLRSSFRDYPARVLDVLQTLAAAERRPAEAVYSALRAVRQDVFKARIEADSSGDGSLGLWDGASAFRGLRDLYLFSALAERGPKALFAMPSKEETQKLLRPARLGQTERGSYVVRVVSEIPPVQQALDPQFPQEAPLERRVLHRLAVALHAAHDAGLADTEAAFQEQVAAGLSANLCFALGKLAPTDRTKSVSFEWHWSWAFPKPQVPHRLSFSSQLIRKIQSGGELLRAFVPEDNYLVIGTVRLLEKQQEANGRHVEIIEERGGRAKRVHLFLTGEAHLRAVEAYTTGQLVTCAGRLERQGTRHVLVAPRDFAVIPGSGSKPSGE